MVIRDLQREAQPRRQAWLHPARLAGKQTTHGQAEPLAHGQLALQRLGLVTVAGGGDRAAGQKAGVETGSFGQLGHEGGICRGAAQVQAEQGLLGRPGFAYRRDHSGGHVGRAAAEFFPLAHDDSHLALRGAPGDRQTYHATADDGYVK